jgi:hypothetical protein
MKNHECNAWVITAVYGGDPVLALNGGEKMDMGDENPFSPVAKAFDRARFNHALDKTKAASIDGWDEESGTAAPAPKPSKDFVTASDERFKKVSARIREIFGPEHMEEAEEAIALAKKVRDEARAEKIATQ